MYSISDLLEIGYAEELLMRVKVGRTWSLLEFNF